MNSLNSLKLLQSLRIVSADPDVSNSLFSAFASAGVFQLLPLICSAEALLEAAESTDILVLDMDLPCQQSWELLKIQGSISRSAVFVISRKMGEVSLASLSPYITYCFLRPFDPERVVATICALTKVNLGEDSLSSHTAGEHTLSPHADLTLSEERSGEYYLADHSVQSASLGRDYSEHTSGAADSNHSALSHTSPNSPSLVRTATHGIASDSVSFSYTYSEHIAYTHPYELAHGMVTKALIELGVPPHLQGYALLREAIKILLFAHTPSSLSLMQDIYPSVAELCGCTVSQAEHAMRHGVDSAWMRAPLSTLQDWFGYTTPIHRSTPSNSAFLFTVAEKVKRQLTLFPTPCPKE